MKRSIIPILLLSFSANADVVDELIQTYGDRCPTTINQISKPALEELSSFQQLLSSYKNNDKCFPPDDPVLKNLESKYEALKESHSDIFNSQTEIAALQTKLEYLLNTLNTEQAKTGSDRDEDRIADLKQQVIDTQSELTTKSDELAELQVSYKGTTVLSKNLISDVELFKNGVLANTPDNNEDDCATPKLRFATSLVSNTLLAVSSFTTPTISLALQGGAVISELISKSINDKIWQKRINEVAHERKVIAYSCIAEVLSQQYCDAEEKKTLLNNFVQRGKEHTHLTDEQELRDKLPTATTFFNSVANVVADSEKIDAQDLIQVLFSASEGKTSPQTILKDVEKSFSDLDEYVDNPWKKYLLKDIAKNISDVNLLLNEGPVIEWANESLQNHCQSIEGRANFDEPMVQKAYDVLNCIADLMPSKNDTVRSLIDATSYLDLKTNVKLNNLGAEERDRVLFATRNQFLQQIGLNGDISDASLDQIRDNLESVTNSSIHHLTSFYDFQKSSFKKVFKELEKSSNREINEDFCIATLPFFSGKVNSRIYRQCKGVVKNSYYDEVKPLKWSKNFYKSKKSTALGNPVYRSTNNHYERICGLRNFYKQSKVVNKSKL